jgi:hypothetical protein
MSRALGVILAALIAVQLGMAVASRRADPPRPADPGRTPPVRVAGDVG